MLRCGVLPCIIPFVRRVCPMSLSSCRSRPPYHELPEAEGVRLGQARPVNHHLGAALVHLVHSACTGYAVSYSCGVE